MSSELVIRNPATGEIIERILADEGASVAQSYARARAAQQEWASTTLSARQEALSRFREGIVANQDALARTTTRETGKPIQQARNELRGLAQRIDFFLENVGPVLQAREVYQADGMQEQLTQEPLGVVANISAWNYPYFVGSNVFVPALLTGNTVLYKPSEHATLTGLAIGRLLHQAGVPEDAFIVVKGEGATGAALLAQPVDGVFFTGSYATGRKIAESAAPQLKRLQLELGGKDPVYVADDAQVQVAAEASADGAFYNAGQSCCAVERLYVHEKIYDDFVAHFVGTVRAFVVGDPTDEATYIGPLTRKEQLLVLREQIDDATARGAQVACGGQRLAGKGQFFAPTVLTGVDHSMRVMREETFGPLIGIQKVSGDDEASALMSDTAYGLTAGVYSQSEQRARAILSRMNTGSVYWNCCDRVSPRLPWSGRGHSGVGSTLGLLGIGAFVQPKAWHLRSL
jgi:acyl-CoA reductase-like NAD-dependent aldehyde dehydrogenase